MLRRIQMYIFLLKAMSFNQIHLWLTKVLLIIAILPFLGFRMASAQLEQPQIFSITVSQGQVEANNRTIRVLQGDTVKMQWISDKSLILHLHGYDLTLNLLAGELGSMDFKAHATGRYPVAIHHANNHKKSGHHGGAVLYLEVYPR